MQTLWKGFVRCRLSCRSTRKPVYERLHEDITIPQRNRTLSSTLNVPTALHPYMRETETLRTESFKIRNNI